MTCEQGNPPESFSRSFDNSSNNKHLADKLVVYLEDSDDDCVLFEHALRTAGLPCRLRVITTGPRARDYFSTVSARELPSVIISDIALAGTCGLELLGWIRKQPLLANIPIILVTGSLSSAQAARAKELGVTDCVEKSAQWKDLIARVERVLAKK